VVHPELVELSYFLLILVLLSQFKLSSPFILQFGLMNSGARPNIHLLLINKSQQSPPKSVPADVITVPS